MLCLLGAIRPTRAYYHCKHCHDGQCPGDGALGLGEGDLTPGAAGLVSLFGVTESFATAAERLLNKAAGLRVSESTVRRTTEAVGTELGHRQQVGEVFGPSRDWAWHKDADGRTCAYLSVDATGVRQQGPRGAVAEGRMAAVAMVYNPIPEADDRKATARPTWQSRYLASLDGATALAEPLRRQAARVGLARAERLIALSDGGSGLEDRLRAHFPRVDAVILDFYHASEHLGELAKAWEGVGTEPAKARHAAWAQRLKHDGGEAMLAELKALELPPRATVRDAWRATVTYFENQSHRMDYPTYRAHGWQIGPGPVESACKTVAGQRLKEAGMRWREPGSNAVCRLRSLFLSEEAQWEAFWDSRRRAA
jgi:hypothetical protein